MNLEDVLGGIGQTADFIARTQRGWVQAIATIFAGASKAAIGLLGSGKDPEEIRAIIEDLADNPPEKATFKPIVDKIDKIKEERLKNPPKLP